MFSRIVNPHRLERGIVVVWETLRRTISRLDYRLYSSGRRIRRLKEGLAPEPSKKVAVFVLFSSAVPAFTLNFIKALNRGSYNIIIVANADIEEVAKTELMRHCCLLVERANVGRDFGGYKDGIGIALQRFPGVRRLVIANDSLFYLERGLDRLVAGLDGPQDFIGVSEVFEHHYHVASFLLSFGPGVLADPVFHRFWAGYRPITTRMWAILEGEGELTRVLVEAGHRPHVLFRAEALVPKLRALSAQEARDAVALFPTAVRPTLSAAAQANGAGPASGEFAEAVFKEVMARNQMHTAGFAFMKFLGLPLIKRDIVFRELYSVEEVNRIMADFGEPLRAEIVADLAGRPSPSQFDPVRKLFYRHGHI